MDLKRLKELFSCQEQEGSLSEKINSLSSALVGLPYVVSPLIGSASESEQFTVSFDGFDCVTFVETVLAVCLSNSPTEFSSTLKEIRYSHGRIEWLDRNHYSVDWIGANQQKGLVKDITPKSDAVAVTRSLSILADYPSREHTIKYLPFPRIERHSSQMETGDLIYFGTTREDLDVMHVGFLVKDETGLVLRHCAKSLGGVVNEPLADSLVRFGESPGVIIVRPCGGSVER